MLIEGKLRISNLPEKRKKGEKFGSMKSKTILHLEKVSVGPILSYFMYSLL